jgi:hypothetical protein
MPQYGQYNTITSKDCLPIACRISAVKVDMKHFDKRSVSLTGTEQAMFANWFKALYKIFHMYLMYFMSEIFIPTSCAFFLYLKDTGSKMPFGPWVHFS